MVNLFKKCRQKKVAEEIFWLHTIQKRYPRTWRYHARERFIFLFDEWTELINKRQYASKN